MTSVVIGMMSVALVQDDDTEFARGMARRGWFDWAEERCELMLKDSRQSAEAKGKVPFVRAEILLAQAEDALDLDKAQKLVDGSIELLKKFMSDQASHPLANEARNDVGWLYTKKAQLISKAVKAETSPDRQAQLQKRAIEIYVDVEKFYQGCIQHFKAAPQNSSNEDALMDARLEFPKALLEHAKLPGVDGSVRSKLLDDAAKLLVDYEFDYGDRPKCYEAMKVEGECRMEMRQDKEAEQRFMGAISLLDRLAEAKPPIPPNDYHWGIVRGAYVGLSHLYRRQARPKDAIALIDKAMKQHRGLDRETKAAFLLDKAQSLFESGDATGANTLAKSVMTSEASGPMAVAAAELIKSWVTGPSSGPKRLGPDQHMTAAETFLEKDQFHEALQSLRGTIEACAMPADKDKFAALAYFKMGKIFVHLRRLNEAAAAFETVFSMFPKHDLAAGACYEAARCYANEFNFSGDKADEEKKEKYLDLLLKNWPARKEARNIPYLLAEKMENAGDLKKAAELYTKVPEDADAYESALVRAGYCYRVDAAARWAKDSKSEAARKEVMAAHLAAEETLKKFLARLGKPEFEPKEQEQIKTRANLAFIANQQLALVYLHESVGKTAECQALLDACAKALTKEDDRLGRIWGLKIQAYLSLNQVDEATKVLDLMFENFPYGLAIAQACKSVAIRLHQASLDLIDKKGDESKIRANLERVSKYYAKWLDQGPSNGLRVTTADVQSVADTLYMIAKRLNGLEENVICFLDLKDGRVTQNKYWKDAAFVHSLLVEGKATGRLSDKERLTLMSRLARCHSFYATTPQEWEKAKTYYDEIVKSYKLVDDKQRIQTAVLVNFPPLLQVYIELGYVYLELAKKGGPASKFQYDNASTVFNNILAASVRETEPWWLARYVSLLLLYERGEGADVKLAKIGLENLEKNNPAFDGGKFGMQAKFVDLKQKLDRLGK